MYAAQLQRHQRLLAPPPVTTSAFHPIVVWPTFPARPQALSVLDVRISHAFPHCSVIRSSIVANVKGRLQRLGIGLMLTQGVSLMGACWVVRPQMAAWC